MTTNNQKCTTISDEECTTLNVQQCSNQQNECTTVQEEVCESTSTQTCNDVQELQCDSNLNQPFGGQIPSLINQGFNNLGNQFGGSVSSLGNQFGGSSTTQGNQFGGSGTSLGNPFGGSTTSLGTGFSESSFGVLGFERTGSVSGKKTYLKQSRFVLVYISLLWKSIFLSYFLGSIRGKRQTEEDVTDILDGVEENLPEVSDELARVERQVFNNVGQSNNVGIPANSNCRPVSRRVCKSEPVSTCRNVPRQRCQLNRGNCTSTPQRCVGTKFK